MRSAMLALLIVTCAAGNGCAKHRTPPKKPEPAPVTPAPTSAPSSAYERDPEFSQDSGVVVYRRRGGFFGTDDRVVIWSNGLLQTRGDLMPAVERQLAASELASLRDAFECWDRLRTLERSTAMDAFEHTVFFNGKRVTCDDGNMPIEMSSILDRIDALRTVATDRQD